MNNTFKDRDPAVKLEGLRAAKSRLSAGHDKLPLLASKQASLESGIGGEERVTEVLRNHSLPFDHRIFQGF